MAAMKPPSCFPELLSATHLRDVPGCPTSSGAGCTSGRLVVKLLARLPFGPWRSPPGNADLRVAALESKFFQDFSEKQWTCPHF